MSVIPKTHPRAKSLAMREKLVQGYEKGLVAKEGLIAHGRGETFDYLLGEKTSKHAKLAIKSAAASLLLAENSVISVNGNIAALCPKEIVRLSKITNSKIEVNIFYANEYRKKNIIKTLKKNGAKQVLGGNIKTSARLSGIDSARRIVDKNGIYAADVVLVPLEDGDRTIALKKARKMVITFDLNPLSRTAQTADITIVDDVVRGITELIGICKKLSKRKQSFLFSIIKQFDNKKNLSHEIIHIKQNLTRRASFA